MSRFLMLDIGTGICAQDHGRPPEGVSHLDYRHTVFKERLDEDPYPPCPGLQER
ncbi:MAG: hypothetical protein JRF35_14885 [Deltaproteobacteria bacterium]|nr:hypothetical protein [Deltaproteobacteria bacterium]